MPNGKTIATLMLFVVPSNNTPNEYKLPAVRKCAKWCWDYQGAMPSLWVHTLGHTTFYTQKEVIVQTSAPIKWQSRGPVICSVNTVHRLRMKISGMQNGSFNTYIWRQGIPDQYTNWYTTWPILPKQAHTHHTNTCIYAVIYMMCYYKDIWYWPESRSGISPLLVRKWTSDI